MASKAVVWHCLTDQGFQPFPPEVNVQIETAFQAKIDELSFNRGKLSYKIDFRRDPPVQINQSTKIERPIERRIEQAESKAIVWHCQTDKGLQPFPPELNDQIETAFQAKTGELSFNRGKLSYKIDFRRDPPVQINQSTKVERPIERRIEQREVSTSSDEDRMWSSLAAGIETETKVRELFEQRQPAAAGNRLQVAAITKISNTARMKAFASTDQFNLDPLQAHKHGDSFLFHGCGESSVANIQSEGLLLRFAGNGMLGKGLYGAPDPRKSLQYCDKGGSTNGKLSGIVTSSPKSAKIKSVSASTP